MYDRVFYFLFGLVWNMGVLSESFCLILVFLFSLLISPVFSKLLWHAFSFDVSSAFSWLLMRTMYVFAYCILHLLEIPSCYGRMNWIKVINESLSLLFNKCGQISF